MSRLALARGLVAISGTGTMLAPTPDPPPPPTPPPSFIAVKWPTKRGSDVSQGAGSTLELGRRWSAGTVEIADGLSTADQALDWQAASVNVWQQCSGQQEETCLVLTGMAQPDDVTESVLASLRDDTTRVVFAGQSHYWSHMDYGQWHFHSETYYSSVQAMRAAYAATQKDGCTLELHDYDAT